MSMYESQDLLSQYLLFHYGDESDILPYAFGPRDALNFPARCVWELLDADRLPDRATGLDLGCAVGRSTFELARFCHSVTGVDLSASFIRAASTLARRGTMDIHRIEEGRRATRLELSVPADIPRDRVAFETGDAAAFPAERGPFDVVLMGNLIDRVPDPVACLQKAAELLQSGGQLLITSPYTWLEAFTPREKWLGGRHPDDAPDASWQGLRRVLEPRFRLAKRKGLPFLIREHARKYQWSVADGSAWIKGEDSQP